MKRLLLLGGLLAALTGCTFHIHTVTNYDVGGDYLIDNHKEQHNDK